jgi:hypothetical protein
MSYTIERTFEGAPLGNIEVRTRDLSHLQQCHPSENQGAK